MTAADFSLALPPSPVFEARPRWLRPVAFVAFAAIHVVALVGFATYKAAPPPALESLDLTMIAQGDEAPENTKDIQPEMAAPVDPVVPPDLTPPPPIVEEKPPEPEQPPPPPDQMIVDPLPQPPELVAPPPPDQMAFDPLPIPDEALPPTLREVADAIDIPLPPPPPPPPVPTPIPTPTTPPRPVVAQAPPPKPKPKPKPRPTTPPGKDKENQESSEAHRVGLAEGRSQDTGMSRETYGALLISQVRSHKFYPETARERGASGDAVVAFTVGSGGGIATVSIVQSSGSADLDAAARQIVRSVSAPPPPGGTFAASTTIRFRMP